MAAVLRVVQDWNDDWPVVLQFESEDAANAWGREWKPWLEARNKSMGVYSVIPMTPEEYIKHCRTYDKGFGIVRRVP